MVPRFDTEAPVIYDPDSAGKIPISRSRPYDRARSSRAPSPTPALCAVPNIRHAVLSASAVLPLASAAVVRQPARPAQPPLPFDQPLPPMDGQHLRMKVVDVRMPPGASGAPHSHGCAVVVYVVQGAVRMSVRGGKDSVYHAGEVFHERPTDIHQVSANASQTDSARFTATFVCDRDLPLSTPAPPAP